MCRSALIDILYGNLGKLEIHTRMKRIGPGEVDERRHEDLPVSVREPPGPSVIDRIGRPRSLATIAADQIRELIVTDRLHLGQQLSEASLAEQLGISRTPVRDALLRLQAERLVEIQPQQGSFVFRYDAKQLHSILALREILEVGAVRAAVKLDRDRTAKTLSALVEAGEPLVNADPEAFQAIDTAFHQAVMTESQNPELIDAYGRITGRVRAIRHRVNRTVSKFAGSQADHVAIVAAIRARDDARAEQVLARHVYNSYFGFLEDLERAGRTSGPTRGGGK
jgi:DNA-binding GntR family transcriptional regulator